MPSLRVRSHLSLPWLLLCAAAHKASRRLSPCQAPHCFLGTASAGKQACCRALTQPHWARAGSTHEQAAAMEEVLVRQLARGEAADPEFTAAVLARLEGAKARAHLRELHAARLAAHVAQLEARTDPADLAAVLAWDAPDGTPAEVGLCLPGLLARACRAACSPRAALCVSAAALLAAQSGHQANNCAQRWLCPSCTGPGSS